MLSAVEIRNYRAFREARVTLARLTAVVGPNASGKSSFLGLLDQGHHLSPTDTWRRLGGQIEITYLGEDGARVGWFPNPMTKGLQFKHRSQRLRLELDALRRPNTLQKESSLAPDGGNLPNLFGSLTRRKQVAVAEELSRLVPMFSDVDAEPIAAGQHTLRFQDRWQPSLWYLPGDVSDGTLLALAFLLIQHQQNPPDLVTIEEPERGFHPYLLGQLVDYLRRLSTGELGGKPIQIIMATHSADLLDHLRPEEVRFFSRRADDGSIEVHEVPAEKPGWQDAYREYGESIGQMWLSGGLGGVPG